MLFCSSELYKRSFCLSFKLLNRFVDFSELELKIGIKERTVVITVIVVAIFIHMASRCCNRRLMTVDGVTARKVNNFVGNLKQLVNY
jgi:hypothetical protein